MFISFENIQLFLSDVRNFEIFFGAWIEQITIRNFVVKDIFKIHFMAELTLKEIPLTELKRRNKDFYSDIVTKLKIRGFTKRELSEAGYDYFGVYVFGRKYFYVSVGVPNDDITLGDVINSETGGKPSVCITIGTFAEDDDGSYNPYGYEKDLVEFGYVAGDSMIRFFQFTPYLGEYFKEIIAIFLHVRKKVFFNYPKFAVELCSENTNFLKLLEQQGLQFAPVSKGWLKGSNSEL